MTINAWPYQPLDVAREAQESLEAKLLEGLQGPENELTPDDWGAIRAEALARLAARKPSNSH